MPYLTRSIAAAALVAALCALSRPAAAQAAGEPLRGEVVLSGRGIPGVPVELHQVTADRSGVIATTTSGAGGAFGFEVPPPASDGFTVYFTTADYLGVRYFGNPIHPSDQRDGYRIAVHDTTSTLPGAVRVSRRDLVLAPHTDGGWEVNEVVQLQNTAERTLVSRDGMPTYELTLPARAEEFEAGDGDIPADRLQWMGNRVLVTVPLTPGVRDLFFRYRLPPGARGAALGGGAGVDSVQVYVQQPSPRVTIDGLAPTDIVEADGMRFVKFSGAQLREGAELHLDWEGEAPPVSPVLAGTGAAALLLALGAVAAARNRGRGAA